jgi:hypothetical protein
LVQHYCIYWENNKLAAAGLPIPGLQVLTGLEKKRLDEHEEGLGDIVADLISTSNREMALRRSNTKPRKASMIHTGGSFHQSELKSAMKEEIFDTIMRNRDTGSND